jgi:AraC-like DNA-binding protein
MESDLENFKVSFFTAVLSSYLGSKEEFKHHFGCTPEDYIQNRREISK